MADAVEEWVNYFPDVATTKEAECVLLDNRDVGPGAYLVWCVSDTPGNRLYRITYLSSISSSVKTSHVDVAYEQSRGLFYLRANTAAGLFPTLLHVVWTRKYLDLTCRLPGAVNVLNPVTWSGSVENTPLTTSTMAAVAAEVDRGAPDLPEEAEEYVDVEEEWSPPTSWVGRLVGKLSWPFVRLWSRFSPGLLMAVSALLLLVMVATLGIAWQALKEASLDTEDIVSVSASRWRRVTSALRTAVKDGCLDGGEVFLQAARGAHTSAQIAFEESSAPLALQWAATSFGGSLLVLAWLMWLGAPTLASRGYISNDSFAAALSGSGGEDARQSSALQRRLFTYIAYVVLTLGAGIASIAILYSSLNVADALSVGMESTSRSWLGVMHTAGNPGGCTVPVDVQVHKYSMSPAMLSLPMSTNSWQCALSDVPSLADWDEPLDDAPWFVCNDIVLPGSAGVARLTMVLVAVLLGVFVAVPAIRATLEDFVEPVGVGAPAVVDGDDDKKRR